MTKSAYVGYSLKAWRAAQNGMSQQALATYLGVSHVTISKWEADSLKCSHPKLLALALAHYVCPKES